MEPLDEIATLGGAVAGVASAFAGFFLDAGSEHVLAAHTVHGALLAVPAALAVALALRVGPRAIVASSLAGGVGFVAAELLLVAS